MMAIRLTLPAVLVSVLPSLAMAQVPPIQSPPGMAVDASNAVLPGALSNLGGMPHVATNAALAAATTAGYPNGVWRDHYATGGTADGPLFFQPLTGTCAANGWVNDGGDCVNDAGTNSFKAVHRNNTLNVKEFGASGGGSVDATAAIQAAVTAAQNATPGIYYDYVIFPSGNYCVSTAGGVTATGPRLALVGYGNVIIKVCGAHDTTVLTLNGLQESIQNLQIQGYNSPTATTPALALGSSCVECVVDSRTIAQYGYRAIDNAAPDAKIWARASLSYGLSVARGTAGAFWLRNKFDQPYPTNTAPTGNPTLAAWNGASHVYAANDLVTIGSGAWVLQATTGCTSSGSEPAVAAYGTAISNGSDACVWQLAGPGTYFALQLDTGAGPAFVDKLDATGSFTYSVGLTNYGGGTGPQLVTLRDINAGTPLSGGVLAGHGQGLFIEGGSATNCVLAGCAGVTIGAGWSDKTHIGDGFIAYGNPIGVSVAGGVGLVMNGASIHGASAECVDIAAGVTKFAITGNDFSTGPTWGTCAVAVKVEAGASDYYSITDNIVHGATHGVVNRAAPAPTRPFWGTTDARSSDDPRRRRRRVLSRGAAGPCRHLRQRDDHRADLHRPDARHHEERYRRAQRDQQHSSRQYSGDGDHPDDGECVLLLRAHIRRGLGSEWRHQSCGSLRWNACRQFVSQLRPSVERHDAGGSRHGRRARYDRQRDRRRD